MPGSRFTIQSDAISLYGPVVRATASISIGLLAVCVVLLGLSAMSFIAQRKDWRQKLADAEAGEA